MSAKYDIDKELAKNEAIIERGVISFREMGEALAEIKDGKLYGKKYGQNSTWAIYLKSRWNMSADYADNLIAAAKVIKSLKAAGVPDSELPSNEGAARKTLKKAKELAKSEGKRKPDSSNLKAAAKATKASKAARNGNGASKTTKRFDGEAYKVEVLERWEKDTAIYLSKNPKLTANYLAGLTYAWVKKFVEETEKKAA